MSIRNEIKELKLNESICFNVAQRNTVATYCSSFKEQLGIEFKVKKENGKLKVTRTL